MSNSKLPEPVHLGDGAYVSIYRGVVVITANHHNPNEATDSVWLDGGAAEQRLVEFLTQIAEHRKEQQT